MYLPFLRGKQFELIALRELKEILDYRKVAPIIEPVKKDTKSIETAIKALAHNKVDTFLIVNPQNGDLKKDSEAIEQTVKRLRSEGITTVIPTYILSSDKDYNHFKERSRSEGHLDSGYALIHFNQTSKQSEIKTIVESSNIKFNIIPVNHLFSLRRDFAKTNLAYINDPFVKRKKNADYEEAEDEIFSNDYFYYREEGYNGFSDYLTIGAEYIEGGMLPYAVAIHLTYKDKESENVRIKHFISDTNFDTSDTAGKFGEALSKLVEFINREKIQTVATDQFREISERGSYPGLGIIKKLSIMHHIELIQSLL